MKKIAFLFTFIAASTVLTACNTVQGVGKDIEKGGQAIERVAK